MKQYLSFFCATALSLASVSAQPQAPSPYSGQEQREIKALSEAQIAGLLAGSGMGYAKAAELNGYPGPRHVLELADELGLDAAQRKATQELFEEMLRSAKKYGAELVEAERRLDEAFKNNSIDEASLAELTKNIGLVEARLRAVHLQAHIHQKAILSAKQVAQYMSLRGYRGKGHGGHPHHH